MCEVCVGTDTVTAEPPLYDFAAKVPALNVNVLCVCDFAAQ